MSADQKRAIGWAAAALLGTAISLGGWALLSTVEHSAAIAEARATSRETTAALGERLDRIEDRMVRFEDKIDRLVQCCAQGR